MGWWKRLSLKWRDYITLGSTVMIAVLFFVWFVFGNTTIRRQNTDILEGVRTEVNVHADAAAARTCALTKLVSFIIFTGDARAHRLHTGPGTYLTGHDKDIIHHLVNQACLEVEVPSP